MHYTFREMPDLNGTGKRRMYPKVCFHKQMEEADFYRLMESTCSVKKGVVEAVLQGLIATIQEGFRSENSVKVPGLGVFFPALAMRKGAEVQYLQKKGVRYDTQDVEIKTVNFLADRKWVKAMRKNLQLTKEDAEVKTLKKEKYTEEERYQMAMQFLEGRPFMTVKDYVTLTQLGRTKAGKELKAFAEDPEKGIRRWGRGTRIVYVKRNDN